MKKYLLIMFLVAFIGFSTLAHAALHDRGRGLIYDDVLNITWLKDANYAHTSGYNGPGILGGGSFYGMTPDGPTAAQAVAYAKIWADNLVYGGYDDWRLAKALPVNGVDYNYARPNDGSSDNGFNISAPGSMYPGSTASEIAYMFYVNLENKGYFDVSGNFQSDYGLKNTKYFINIQNSIMGDTYWMDIVTSPESSMVGYFNFYYGSQMVGNTTHMSGYAWAVRDGDVAPVPLPGAILLFAPGLVGLFAFKKRAQQDSRAIETNSHDLRR
ncbi:MAG: hypothetical protein NT010_17000 [Proteobacteria bacterium]|nr:hypothetical protein [Pseudomonadota bacterium]